MGKYNNTEIVLNVSHILVLGPLNGEKGQKIWLNGGQKYKIVNFEADNAFEVL